MSSANVGVSRLLLELQEVEEFICVLEIESLTSTLRSNALGEGNHCDK